MCYFLTLMGIHSCACASVLLLNRENKDDLCVSLVSDFWCVAMQKLMCCEQPAVTKAFWIMDTSWQASLALKMLSAVCHLSSGPRYRPISTSNSRPFAGAKIGPIRYIGFDWIRFIMVIVRSLWPLSFSVSVTQLDCRAPSFFLAEPPQQCLSEGSSHWDRARECVVGCVLSRDLIQCVGSAR